MQALTCIHYTLQICHPPSHKCKSFSVGVTNCKFSNVMGMHPQVNLLLKSIISGIFWIMFLLRNMQQLLGSCVGKLMYVLSTKDMDLSLQLEVQDLKFCLNTHARYLVMTKKLSQQPGLSCWTRGLD